MAIVTIQEFIENRKGDKEPLFEFKWHCLSLPFNGDVTYVESVGLPFPSINVKPMFGGATYSYYPGFLEISAFDITFYEDQRARSRQYVQNWQNKIIDPIEKFYYMPIDYKRDIEVELLNNQNQPIMRARLKGCWPTQSSNWDLRYDGNGRITVQQNFSTDGVEYEFI